MQLAATAEALSALGYFGEAHTYDRAGYTVLQATDLGNAGDASHAAATPLLTLLGCVPGVRASGFASSGHCSGWHWWLRPRSSISAFMILEMCLDGPVVR
jgi:hypothetical protein